ncbi:MAG: hypothetical protein A2506_11400 [Elusimicrobia bacterium RIFOXYD12_FULL_66_9]|nr:MAG: hypothetical protein A2506_11400 [Elusimicrobia bacterium RIFOXYD12_FULL_66_9]
MNVSLALSALFTLAGAASAAVHPVVLAPRRVLAPSAPAVLSLACVASPAAMVPTSAPSLIVAPAAAGVPVPQPAAPAAQAAASPAAESSAAAEKPLKAGSPLWESLLMQARQTTSAATRRILAMRGAVKVRAELATSDTKTITEYTGTPNRVEKLEAPGRVFRHWVLNKDAFAAILEQGALRAGPVSYVEFTGGRHAYIKDIYVDIQGAFFTTPEHSAAEPRVMNQEASYYVDFRLQEGVSALRLDGDDVLVIPASPGTYLPIEIVGSSAL